MPVRQVVIDHASDIALLWFEYPTTIDGEPPRFMVAPLTFTPPTVGEPVLTFGYSEATVSLIDGLVVEIDGLVVEIDGLVVEFDHKVTATHGTVGQLHIPRRDDAMVHFPAIEIDSPTPGGMSGGPVIGASNGHVCGVVCTSLPPGEGETTWTSTASLLALLLHLGMDMVVDGVTGTYSVQDLAAMGVVPTDGSHRDVRFEANSDGGTTLHAPWLP
jgi:hypothetical protein